MGYALCGKNSIPIKHVFRGLVFRTVELFRFPTKYKPCSRLSWTRPSAFEVMEFSIGMISFGQPFGAAMFVSDAGIPIGLSNTQKDWIYGFNSNRILTNDRFIENPSRVSLPYRGHELVFVYRFLSRTFRIVCNKVTSENPRIEPTGPSCLSVSDVPSDEP